MMCSFGSSFKYLGHTISSTNADDTDIHREITNMFVRTNILLRAQIMLKLCCSKPIAALWKTYNLGRRDSITSILLTLGLLSFNTVLANASISFAK